MTKLAPSSRADFVEAFKDRIDELADIEPIDAVDAVDAEKQGVSIPGFPISSTETPAFRPEEPR